MRIVLVFISFCFLVFLYSCKDEVKEEFVEYEGPILDIDNLAVLHSDSGRVKLKFSTAKQLEYQSGDKDYPKAVYVNFIDKNGVEYSQLRGDRGHYSKEKNLYKIAGNVFFNNRLLQQTLATEELFWDPSSKKIYSVKKVIINTPRESITALGGMDATEDFSRYTLRKPKGTFMVDSLVTVVDTSGQ